MAVTEPAVAAKVAVLAPAATLTGVATVSAAMLEERATADPPMGAALERVTVQVLTAPDARRVGRQASEVTLTTGAVRLIEAVAEVALRAAVTTAV